MPERLLKRDGTHYSRAKYPADLQHPFKAGDRWKSLRTKELAHAKLKVRVECVRFDAEMGEQRKRLGQPLKAVLTRAEADAIVAGYIHELMTDDEEHQE